LRGTDQMDMNIMQKNIKVIIQRFFYILNLINTLNTVYLIIIGMYQLVYQFQIILIMIANIHMLTIMQIMIIFSLVFRKNWIKPMVVKAFLI